MTLYNPFRPHLCRFSDGRFGIRKWFISGWYYLDTTDMSYWTKNDYSGSRFNSVEELQAKAKTSQDFFDELANAKKSWRLK